MADPLHPKMKQLHPLHDPRVLLTQGWSINSEPLERGKVKIKSYGCLQVQMKLKGCSPTALYTVGLNVYGVDLPIFGGIARSAFTPGTKTVDGVSKTRVNAYLLGTTVTDQARKIDFETILWVKPGTYDIQLWVSKGVVAAHQAPITCYKSGETFGDSETITITEDLYRMHTAEPLPIRNSGKRIFLDVGANTGQTATAVLDPLFRFDRIICFEPVKDCYQQLTRFGDPRITICPFGLWKETCELPLFNPGNVGGSIFADMNDVDAYERCKFVKASDWFREHVASEDIVFMKLNCEGSECDIVDHLLDSGKFDKVDFIMIDFDVRLIPSQIHREAEVRSRLKKLGYGFPKVSFCKEAMIGLDHAARIQHWLHIVGADK